LWNRSCAVIPLGAASPRTLISDLPGGSGNGSSRLGAPGRHATQTWLLACASLPIWSCSVWGLPCLRPYSRSGALLPHHFTLTPAGTRRPGEPGRSSRMPRPVSKDRRGVAEAVSFLWHWPSASLEARIPDVIRHTALRSSDFPPPAAPRSRTKPPAATARSSCQCLVYRETGLPVAVGDFGRDDFYAVRAVTALHLNSKLFEEHFDRTNGIIFVRSWANYNSSDQS
jgi:hypothetical protein